MKNRPIVISIIALLLLLNGILTLANGYRFQAHFAVMLLGTFALVLGIGVWMLWPWAWVGTVLLQIVAIGYALYDWFSGGPIDFLAMIIGAIVLVYLFRAETRRLFFGKKTVSPETYS